MDALHSLNCYSCKSLTSLPDGMGALQGLNCSWCESLASLPLALPHCTYLNFSRCPLLINTPTPEVPANAEVFRAVANNNNLDDEFYSWSVPYEEVHDDPKRFLCQLGEQWLIKGLPFPSIRYQEKDDKAFEGIDFGGVRRDLVSRILSHLFNPDLEEGKGLSRDANLLPLWQESDQQELLAYMSLARLMALSYLHVCELTTGPLFSETFYRALLTEKESLERAGAWMEVDPTNRVSEVEHTAQRKKMDYQTQSSITICIS